MTKNQIKVGCIFMQSYFIFNTAMNHLSNYQPTQEPIHFTVELAPDFIVVPVL